MIPTCDVTPTESCASEETKEEEEKLVRAPPGLSDPVGEDVKRSDSRHELHACQRGVTANAENHLQPRHKRKEDKRPFEGLITEQASDRQMDQTRLSFFLSWNAGMKRGKMTNVAVGSYHVIRLQAADSHLDEVTKIATEQFHVYHGADQLILPRKNMFEPGGVMTKTVISGTSNQDTFFGLEYLLVRSMFRRTPKHGKNTYTPASVHLSNTTAKKARNREMAFGVRGGKLLSCMT